MESEKQNKTGSIFKKVALGLLIIALLEGWIIYKLNNVEGRVLLSPYYFSELDPTYQDTFFNAKGSWISETKLAFPAQTVELNCFKEFGHCFESLAYIGVGNFLSVSNDLYEIESWTKSEIITKPRKLGCVDYIIKIDRTTKTVTSLRTTINTVDLCKNVGIEPIVSYLGNGQDRIDKIKNQK